MTGRATLVVPFAGLPSAVPPLAQVPTMPHVPLVEPFADSADLDPGVLAELRSYFADVVPFEVRFARLSQFPSGTPYLTPEPTTPFRHMTQGVLRLFPELVSPRTGFELLPRLSIPLVAAASFGQLEAELEPWLPVVTIAREAALWWHAEGEVRTLETFPFGMSAA